MKFIESPTHIKEFGEFIETKFFKLKISQILHQIDADLAK